MSAALRSTRSRPSSAHARGSRASTKRPGARAASGRRDPHEIHMEQRTETDVSPYRIFSRGEWAKLREDTPMTLEPAEIARLRSMHDLLDMSEVAEIYLPLSRLFSLYVAGTQNLFRAQQ